MLTIRKSNDRGLAEHGWLKSRHTFSFAEYYDPQHMGFGPLRVINEDRISGGTGFDTHPHRDMEIISYVISGALRHKDSMGNVALIKPGEVQRMSAGTGVFHSEYNEMQGEETHFFQIWIMPNKRGVAPGYGQKSFEKELDSQKLVHVISPDGKDGSIGIHQDADMYISRLKNSESLTFNLPEQRKLWIQLVKGSVTVNGEKIETGDAIAAQDIGKADITASADSEMILFELPA
ncbi:pirin family protein [Bdellovibrio sp. HCB2-146]|uniref:pirin family protein n=1 Tax=Bdellovibrio sp. HCB2-146 TaxID=3394362 RepID=UPI0039BC4CBD